MSKRLNEVKQVQTGITTRCNSHCRFCFREELLRSSKGDKMHFKDSPCDLPFESYINIFKDTNITDVQFCGNKGDAIFHPEFQKILDYTMDQGVFVSLSTNGSAFSRKWWHDLGTKIKGEVTFALDGLEDTHKIYRNTSFNKVYNNMLSFIEGGGRARWQFIIFKHNQHQVQQAKELSKKIGCQQFITVISRYYDNIMQKPDTDVSKTKRELHNARKKLDEMLPEQSPIRRHLFHDLECQWVRMKRVYMSSRGRIYPCCYVSCHTHDWFTHPDYFELRGLKKPEYNIANNTLNEIIKLPWFTHVYDNVNNYAMCHLHCGNVHEYKTKIRKEEEL